jgi:hypothetical protein
MTLIGYTMMCEQTGPKQLVRDVALAEEAGVAEITVMPDRVVSGPGGSCELPPLLG